MRFFRFLYFKNIWKRIFLFCSSLSGPLVVRRPPSASISLHQPPFSLHQPPSASVSLRQLAVQTSLTSIWQLCCCPSEILCYFTVWGWSLFSKNHDTIKSVRLTAWSRSPSRLYQTASSDPGTKRNKYWSNFSWEQTQNKLIWSDLYYYRRRTYTKLK